MTSCYLGAHRIFYPPSLFVFSLTHMSARKVDKATCVPHPTLALLPLPPSLPLALSL